MENSWDIIVNIETETTEELEKRDIQFKGKEFWKGNQTDRWRELEKPSDKVLCSHYIKIC